MLYGSAVSHVSFYRSDTCISFFPHSAIQISPASQSSALGPACPAVLPRVCGPLVETHKCTSGNPRTHLMPVLESISFL